MPRYIDAELALLTIKKRLYETALNNVLDGDGIEIGLESTIVDMTGEVPMILRPGYVTLEMLDREALIRILTEPKNSIVKQYQKLLELDGVDLQFDKESLETIADISLDRKTGARGLRAIMENVMMDTMYHVPSDESIKSCLITKDVVEGKKQPIYNGEE